MAQLLEFYKNFQSQQKSPKPQSAPPSRIDTVPDEELTELEKTVKYCKSAVGLQRLIHVKILADVAKSSGYEATRKLVIPILETISSDSEPSIRQHLCTQITSLSKFCIVSGGEDGYKSVLDIILPVLAHLLEDEKPEVRQAASVSLTSYSEILTPVDLGQHVLTIILQLAHDDLNEDMRITATELLNALALSFGPELCRQFLIPEIVSLAEDGSFQVRRSIALNYYNICSISGEYELFEKLMPTFVRLSKDDIIRVRRACAECLYNISKCVDEVIQIGVLIEVFLRLAEDPSLQVREVIYQQCGLFISTLPSRVIGRSLLTHYLSMIEGPIGDGSLDNELLFHCAYSFPGVLQAIGCNRWTEIRRVYHTLVHSNQVVVRKTLASSLHIVASLLNSTIIEEELIPVFEEFIQDIEPVRFNLLKEISSFIKLLTMPCRVSYLPLLRDLILSSSPYNWRLRQAIARQLDVFVTLLPAQHVYATLFPLAITLVQDRIAQVRSSVLSGIAQMILVMLPGYQPTYTLEVIASDGSITLHQPEPVGNNEITYLEAIVKAINALIVSDQYIYRQVWIELSLTLFQRLPRDIFEKYFLVGILQLTSDPIVNVRVKIGEMLTGWEKTYPLPWLDTVENPWIWLFSREDVTECVKRLAKDDKDVYYSVRKLQFFYPSIEFSEISCRGMKSSPGGAESIASLMSTPVIASMTSKLNDMEIEMEMDGISEMKSNINELHHETISIPQESDHHHHLQPTRPDSPRFEMLEEKIENDSEEAFVDLSDVPPATLIPESTPEIETEEESKEIQTEGETIIQEIQEETPKEIETEEDSGSAQEEESKEMKAEVETTIQDIQEVAPKEIETEQVEEVRVEENSLEREVEQTTSLIPTPTNGEGSVNDEKIEEGLNESLEERN